MCNKICFIIYNFENIVLIILHDVINDINLNTLFSSHTVDENIICTLEMRKIIVHQIYDFSNIVIINIGFFSIASGKVIAFYLHCFFFVLFFLPLFFISLSISLFKAIVITFTLLFAIAFKSEKHDIVFFFVPLNLFALIFCIFLYIIS